MARIAKSLDVLRSQINAKYPNRSKVSDGWLGDTAHAARASDHNPNGAAVVTALDITHDLAHGVDTWKLAEILRQRRDRRIKYVISNGRIFSSEASPWVWRTYTGSNKHAHHIHISVAANPVLYDGTTSWDLSAAGTIAMPPTVTPPKGITATMRQRMMAVILGYEGRFVDGKLQVHIAADGLPEIGGITQKDHPATYARLKELLDLNLQDKLKDEVLKYYDQYTDQAENWTNRAGVEFFLRDCILNRGPTGAATILQMAVGTDVDAEVGPTTRGALARLDPIKAIDELRAARERYELFKYGRRDGLWAGLVNRWNKAQAQAKAFQREQGKTIPTGTVEAVGGGIVAAFLAWLGAHPIVIVGFIAATIGLVIYLKRRKK